MSDLKLNPIPGCSGYFAGSDGTIWSAKPGRHGRFKSLHPMRPYRDDEGYLNVTLRPDSRRRRYFVHQLVATAFHGLCPEGLVTRHRDGDQNNNRPENLLHGTQAQNIADREAHGRTVRGDQSHLAKVTDAQALEILRRFNAGESGPSLAQAFGVTKSMVYALKHGRIRRHLAIVPQREIA